MGFAAARLCKVFRIVARYGATEALSRRRVNARGHTRGPGEGRAAKGLAAATPWLPRGPTSLAMTRCSGGEGGVDGGDDDDDDGDDAPLDDDGDGVDFPLREGISRIPARRRALFSLVFSAPQAAVTLREVLCGLGFRDEGVREEKEAKEAVGPPEHRVARPGHGPRRPMVWAHLEGELQKRFEHHDPCEMIRELKVIFETHAAVESYEASKQFFGCMMEEGSFVSEHVFAMFGHARKLSDLGIVIPNQLGIHRVLQSLPPSYKNFVMNYTMQNMNKELPELFSILKSAEVEIQKEHQVLMVNKTTNFKKKIKPKKGNFKKGGRKLPRLLRSLRVALNLILTAITAMGRGTGSGIAPSTWLI
ncbi:hypothetical protein QYE76_060124 [Lolium multiflorum]|uniref:Uncharacterized protein n=1 Tax=Lolium multiflorum TaxID=4521 RepID=A0AAD8W5Z0_LOLMU|nr:hypothetical protein QYE76_060124 [Lolium multiflorum]